jgi:hypothetical protein
MGAAELWKGKGHWRGFRTHLRALEGNQRRITILHAQCHGGHLARAMARLYQGQDPRVVFAGASFGETYRLNPVDNQTVGRSTIHFHLTQWMWRNILGRGFTLTFANATYGPYHHVNQLMTWFGDDFDTGGPAPNLRGADAEVLASVSFPRVN